MHVEELRAKAEARAKTLPPALTDALETFRGDATQFFARIPEPPVYRRRDDPAKQEAQALLEVGEELLARSIALGGRDDTELWRAALDAHLESLCLVAEGRVEAADTVWHQATALERKAAGPRRLWRRTDEAPAPVFDAQARVSRYDPRPEAALQARLPCPGCRKTSDFGFSPRHAQHPVRCPHCGARFTAYLAEIRSSEARKTPGRIHYVFRLEALGGAQTRLEVDDTGHDELRTTRGDLVAFLYLPEGQLRGVLNLESSRVLWLASTGPCFVATVAFGEGAPELDVLRAFRDRVLLPSRPGRVFVAWYYRRGPALARTVQAHPRLQQSVRAALSVVTAGLKRSLE